MTKKKKKLQHALPKKCPFCGGKKVKRNSDNSADRLLPTGKLLTQGPVLCNECGQTYNKTDVYIFEEVKSGQRKGSSTGVREEDGQESS